ncbi:MAG: hypothetical protein ABSH20_30305, partial [Tepidisphaeraceae bacterium]
MPALPSASRRDFLRRCLSGAVALGTSRMAEAQPAALAAKSRVVVAHDPMLRGTGAAVDAGRIRSLLDRAMPAHFDRDRTVDTPLA